MRIGLPWVVIVPFSRLTKSLRVLEKPLSVERACAYVEEWLFLPGVQIVVSGAGHRPIFWSLLAPCGAGGNWATDAYIALALEYGYTVYSSDHDLGCFAGLRHINLLSG